MTVSIKKLLNLSTIIYPSAFTTTSMKKIKFEPIHKIHTILKKKSSLLFIDVTAIIKKYTNQTHGNHKKIDENLLWQLILKHQNASILKTFIDHDQKLLSLFENPLDLLQLKKKPMFKRSFRIPLYR